MVRRIGVILALLALVASACSKTTSKEVPKEAKDTYTVFVDYRDKDLNNTAIKYFPGELKAHAGQTIRFKSNFSGEAHTVTFGTVIEQAFAAIAKLGPNPDEEKIFGLPEVQKIPSFFPFGPEGPPPGPPVPNQAAAQACFVDTAPASAKDPCPKVAQPEFTGKAALYSSGFLEEGTTYSVKLAADLAPGVYNWLCLVHGAEMKGKLTVAAATETIPDPKAVEAAREDEIAKFIAPLKAAVDAAKPVAGEVQASFTAKDVPGIAALFSPKEISVAVGGKVTWKIFDFHSIAFNAPQDASPAFVKAADGSVQFNLKAINPTGGPGLPNPFGEPSKETTFDGGSWDGTGFRSSGGGGGEEGTPLVFTLTFTKAGTYDYACLIHPDMEGTVKVG
jgi:plastocyanin